MEIGISGDMNCNAEMRRIEAQTIQDEEVMNLRDVITFQGRAVEELKHAFADDLAFCRERGEELEKPYSGQLMVRPAPPLHQGVATAARRQSLSLNKWVVKTLERASHS